MSAKTIPLFMVYSKVEYFHDVIKQFDIKDDARINKLISLFELVDDTFECIKVDSEILNLTFIAIKLLERLCIKKHNYSLRTPQKIEQQEQYWKNICEELDW